MLLIQRFDIHLNPGLSIILQYKFPLSPPLLSIKERKEERETEVSVKKVMKNERQKEKEHAEKEHKKGAGSIEEDCD